MKVSILKIAKYAKHFDLLVVYESGVDLPFRESAESVFRTCTIRSFDQTQVDGISLNPHLFIICGSAPFLRTAELKNFILSVQSLETILLSPDFKDINLLRTALSLRLSGVHAIPQNEEEFVNVMMGVFSTLVKKHNESVLRGYERTISEYSNNLFWIHKGGKAIYVNDTLKRRFGIKNLGDLDPFFENKEMAPLFKTSGFSQKIISLKDGEGDDKEYFVTNQPLKEGEALVSMFPLIEAIQKGDKRLHNRMDFIELLKDAFAIQKRENEAIPVIIMYIENGEKIIEMRGEDVYNEICKEIVKLTETHFDHETQMAQWHKDVFTLITSNFSLDELKGRLERFHENLNREISIEGAFAAIDSFIIDMHGVELNKAIGIIDHINQKQLLSRDLAHLVHFQISATPHDVDEKIEALHYLEKMIMTKTSVKLLNFYKGIRISTAAQLVKISNGMVYVAIEKMQGYAMKLEGNVVIQGVNIPFDILAHVKLVDIAKKIAVLSNFEPLEASGNNRQYIRIQSDHRMHVTIAAAKSVMSGTILDISIKSIACRLNVSKAPVKLGSNVSLQFNLPLERFDGGMVMMAVSGKIQYIQEGEEFSKVVVELELMEPYESYLIEYIYARQQALVNEIKTIANKL
jgi:GGDEF domain-containing protein